MDYVYVVTYGLKGAGEGEFHSERAYVNIEGAEVAAHERMDMLSSPTSDRNAFALVDTKNYAHPHVIKRWDSKGPYGHTVWLERLEVQE